MVEQLSIQYPKHPVIPCEDRRFQEAPFTSPEVWLVRVFLTPIHSPSMTGGVDRDIWSE